jgi:RNA polymerase-binding transcription factor
MAKTRKTGRTSARGLSPDRIRERVLAERATAVEALARLGLTEGEDGFDSGESPFEAGDVAQASERQDMTFAQRERLAARIDRLTRALERLAQGQYGVCEECGQSIEPARLVAMPEVAVCRQCQERLERERAA